MNRNLIITIAGALALGLAAAAALAEEPAQVTVVATRMVSTTIASTSPTGTPIVDVSLSYGVSTVGLDLSSREGAQELELRVKDAANAACKEVGRQYPGAMPSDMECARLAVKKAMVTVHRLVREASKAAAK